MICGTVAADKQSTPLDYALAYLKPGLAVLPIKADGSKAPAVAEWRTYQKRLPTEVEARRWWANGQSGIALIGGAVSGNLEQLDFDAEAETIFPAWRELVEAEAPGLAERLSVAATPRGGYHVRYRCPGVPIPGNGKLAVDAAGQTLIETRGEGGYALAPGCPAGCHASGRTYRHHSGPPAWELPAVTAAEREILLRCARVLDRAAPAEEPTSASATGKGPSPGDDYCERGADWPEILDGWQLVREREGLRFWRRPGKADPGWSATTGKRSKAGRELLCVFTSNAPPFPGPSGAKPCSAHSKFGAFALLRHGGDFQSAARELAAQGFGAMARNGTPHGSAAGNRKATAEAWRPAVPLDATPPAEAFPLDVLPGPLAEFVADVGRSRCCPVDYAAVPLLALAGAAIGASRVLEIKPGWRERPALYAAIVGPPGSAKTPALKAIASPFYAEQTRRLGLYRQAKKAWQEQQKEAKGAAGEAPVLATIYVSDVTTEKLADVLQENPRGMAMIRDELNALVAALDCYRSGGRGADRHFYLSAWAGEPVRVDRKHSDDPVYVAHPFLSVVGGLPPATLPVLRGVRGTADGFLDRFLFAYPVPFPAEAENWASLDELQADNWRSALRWLWDLKLEVGEDGPRPHFVRLTADGRCRWEQFTARLAAEMNRDDLPDPVKGHLAKFRGYGARLALIVQCLRLAAGEVESEDVDAESMGRAARLVGYFEAHARKVHAAMGSDTRLANAKRVWQWIGMQDGATFTRREAYRAIRHQLDRVEDTDPVLALLAGHGFIRPVDEDPRPGRGRPSEIYEVNPLERNSRDTGQMGQKSDSGPFVCSNGHRNG